MMVLSRSSRPREKRASVELILATPWWTNLSSGVQRSTLVGATRTKSGGFSSRGATGLAPERGWWRDVDGPEVTLAWEATTEALGDAGADVTWEEESDGQYLDRHGRYEGDHRQLLERSKKKSAGPLLERIE